MKSRFLLLLPLTLLLGADEERIVFEGPLPACRKGEFMTMRNGEPLCTDLVRPLITTPDCSGLLAAPRAYTTDWTCQGKVSLGKTEVDRLPSDIQRAKDAQRVLQEKRVTPFGQTRLVGVTAKKSTGRMARAGIETGLLSANALCADEFPAAHMCSGYEIYDSVTAGVITPARPLDRAWVFHPSWKAPLPGAQNAAEGLADNCASYTYDLDDRGWSGIAAEFSLSTSTFQFALKFAGGTQAPCSALMPIACCK